MARQLLTSASAAVRLDAAAAWLRAHPPGVQVLVVAPALEAAGRVVRAATARASFGFHRLTPGLLARELALPVLGPAGRTPVAGLGLEAVAARVLARLGREGALGRLAAVAERPGLPRALARTLLELRLAGVAPDALAGRQPELAGLLAAHVQALLDAGLADRADVLAAALVAARAPAVRPPLGLALLWLDAPVASRAEAELLAAVVARAPSVLCTVAAGDAEALARCRAALAVEPTNARAAGALVSRGLASLQERLFQREVLTDDTGSDVQVLSAPGESRECVELVRRLLGFARAGVPFDRMAVLLRNPESYRAHLVEALRRAQVPAWFSRGTVRPDRSGRALLALLACAHERLSARRFAEYLSLGVVPAGGPAPVASEPVFAPAEDELVAPLDDAPELPEPGEDELLAGAAHETAVVAGSLRAPRRWERLLVDAAVIGGRERWRRRLAGLAQELRARLAALEEPEDPLRAVLTRELEDLEHLGAFALPLLAALEALPSSATWGEWCAALDALARRALRQPERVLGVLAELAPMADVGPVDLGEVQRVLTPRLRELLARPAGGPAGKVLIAGAEESRGLAFEVVLVPGLAERMFPRKVAEDPILLDADRAALSPELADNDTRSARERLALRLAVGAATRAVVLSYPRVDVDLARPRVPSFYGLEVLRASEGSLPGFDAFMQRADAAGESRLAWPAPADARDAVDAAEYDLAVLERLLAAGPERSRGAAHYLLATNAALSRVLRARVARWSPRWSRHDGVVHPSAAAATALAAHRLDARAYSATALQAFAECPYKLVLRNVHGLAPRSMPEAIEELDPQRRGELLVHEVQARALSFLRAEALLPVRRETLPRARAMLEGVLAEVEARRHEELLPAIERVWTDGIAALRFDLLSWLERLAEEPQWVPAHFELAFGLSMEAGRDPASRAEPVVLADGLRLCGAIDLVERDGRRLRATDHKTGRVRFDRGRVIDGGRTLQPVLYALALERLYPEAEVVGGRLYYCTTDGDFEERPVALDTHAREAAQLLVATVRRALDEGFLPAAPRAGACRWCDYRAVCGPDAEQRSARKERGWIGALERLRAEP